MTGRGGGTTTYMRIKRASFGRCWKLARKICYMGEGGGKTVAALGLALRAWGHGKRVVMVQFMKGRQNIGEFKAAKKLPGFAIFQFGREEFVDLKNPSAEDKQLAKQGLIFVKDALKENPDMLILDEINLACHIGLIQTNEVVKLIESAPKKTILVLTGRYPPPELRTLCDIVTKIDDVKTIPMDKRGEPEAGFEF
jgi:cob(I)alamin adenosyltransferase